MPAAIRFPTQAKQFACFTRTKNIIVFCFCAGKGNRLQVPRRRPSSDSQPAARGFACKRNITAPIRSPTQAKQFACFTHTKTFVIFCAGKGNRTPVSTLGRSHSTTRPYPHIFIFLQTLYATTQ